MIKPGPRSGFTLLELTCALFVITMAGFGAIQLYHVGFEKMREMGELDLAAAALRNEMEQIRALPYDGITDRDGMVNPAPALERLHGAELAVRVEEVMPGLKEVSLTLRWQNYRGRWITRSLHTRVAETEAAP